MQGVVSTADLAKELGRTPETVVRWIREGRFHGAVRRRGRWCIPTEEAEAFAEVYERAQEDYERAQEDEDDDEDDELDDDDDEDDDQDELDEEEN